MSEGRGRILIVEDERIIARDLARRLERLGFEVVAIASTGEDAIRVAERERPSLILMDIRLQGPMDGTQAADRISSAFQIPIVFLTAYADDATLRAARISEPYGYILKPFDERELHVVIEMALYKHAAERERARLEELTRRSQKMDAIGQLAGGVAHEFNNALTVILNSCRSLIDTLPARAPEQTQVALIRTAAERAARTTRELLAFGRATTRDTAPTDLGAIVNGMTAMLARLIGDDVALVADVGPELRAIEARSDELEQLVLNLVVNARDALPDGGAIRIGVANADDSGGAPCVVLTVRDDGIGMDEATRARLFEPFFTTKDVGEGSGLGLAAVYAIAKRHGATIDVASAPGAGTTFTLGFPATASAPVNAPRARAVDAPTALRGKILVVEDDHGVRKVLRTILRNAGLSVWEARNGVEALAICSAHPGEIDLVVSDVVMPEMGGADLGARLEELQPTAKMLYVTGYPDRTVPGSRAQLTAPVLQKPFTAEQLLARVRDVLAESAG